MRRLFRILRRVLAGAVFIVLLVAAVVTGVLWLTLPPRSQQARIPGLTGPVDIGFDADGIPRIRAADRDRCRRRSGLRPCARPDVPDGADAPRRLRPAVGNRRPGHARARPHHAHARPAAARGGGLSRPARRDPRHAGGLCARRERLDRGSAAGSARRSSCSSAHPEPWEPVDSLLWGQTMGLWLSLNWRTELSRQSLAGRVPQQMIDELWPPAAGDGRPEAALRARPEPRRRRARRPCCRGSPTRYTLPDSASNEWAVDGRHTATGAPLLAGDPHLAFGFPGIWYLARIETPDGVLAGATAPGVPFLVLGHNGHIAWTFTTTGADVQDVFIETPAGDGQYQTPGRPPPLRRARGAHQGARRARPGPDGARDAPWPGDERPAGQRRPDPGRGDGQSGSQATPPPPACSRSIRRATWTPPARPPR